MNALRRRVPLLWIAASALVLAWIVLAYGLLPWVLRGAYRGESLPILNRLISGQAVHPVEYYLGLWHAVTWKGTLGLVLFLFVTWLARRYSPQIEARLERRLGPAGRPLRPAAALLVCVWAGIVTGLLEATIAAIRYLVAPQPYWEYVVEAVWMAPLVAAVLFVAVGCVVLLLAVAWPPLRSLAVMTFILGATASYILLRVLPLGLFPWAALLLGLGLGSQAVRTVVAHSQGFTRLVRRSTIALAGAIVLIGLSIPLTRHVRERRTLSRLVDTPAGLPNVLLIILDTVRAHNLSFYGYERDTSPYLARLAADAVVFDRAVVPSSWTLPSHASLFTGRHALELSADWEVALDDDFPTLAELLQAHGYATAAFVANYFYTMRPSGLARGFVHYDPTKPTPEFVLENSWAARTLMKKVRKRLDMHRPHTRKTAAEVNAEFLRWLPSAGERPFFGFLNYFDAHDPYLPPEPYLKRFGSGHQRYWLGGTQGPYRPSDLAELVESYDGSIAYLDDQVEHLLGELDRSGALQNTLVIITSDHGEQFGEKRPGLANHGNSLYWSSLHVPLMIWYPPAVPRGTRVGDAVTLQDLPATIVDLLAIPGAPLPGASLAGYWSDPSGLLQSHSPLLAAISPHDHIQPSEPASAGPMQAVLSDSLHYIRNGDGSEELYDVVTDPWERHDLSQTAVGRRALLRLRTCLDDLMNAYRSPIGQRQQDLDAACSGAGPLAASVR